MVVVWLLIAAATAGKSRRLLRRSRLTGLASREALGLGILMNTRGLTELVVLNIGLDVGLISQDLFSMMVIHGACHHPYDKPTDRLSVPEESACRGPDTGKCASTQEYACRRNKTFFVLQGIKIISRENNLPPGSGSRSQE